MHRLIRKYTHWILIFGCLACVAVLKFVISNQCYEVLNKVGLIETTIGESEVKMKNQKAGVSKAALPGTSEVTNQIRKASALSATSRNENRSFVSMTTERQRTLRRWNSSHPIVFLHVGKNGGTSFDATIGPIVRRLGGRYVGYRHFDWSYIETLKHSDVVVLLRDSVARAVSHFHFTKMRIAKKRLTLKVLENVSLSEYIRDPQKMLEAHGIWRDGQAAALWLTGTHIETWVGIKLDKIPERETRFLDHKNICLKAGSRLKDTLWFGFLDDQERSFDMLQWQLGYDKKIRLAHRNKTPHADITAEDKAILESLMPIDLWIYEYAKTLFDARWEQYKTGVYRDPKMPPFPQINCKSTRYILACNGRSPLGPLYHVWNATDKIEQHVKLLPKQEWISKGATP